MGSEGGGGGGARKTKTRIKKFREKTKMEPQRWFTGQEKGLNHRGD